MTASAMNIRDDKKSTEIADRTANQKCFLISFQMSPS